MHSRDYFLLTGGLFGLVALGHAVRLVAQVQVQVGTWIMPLWVSWVGLIVAGMLCAWATRLARR